MSVRTRFAPSPTGYLHIGGVRTALFNWLFARAHGGEFILRIDDTDQQRNDEAALAPILGGFQWLGIDWDEGPEVEGSCGPYYQSQRGELYQAAVAQLLQTGHAYRDFARTEEIQAERDAAREQGTSFVYSRRWAAETPDDATRYEAEGRPEVVRLKMPRTGTAVLNDLVRGKVEFDWAAEQDHVIRRGDGSVLYNLATVVDDHAMNISHVIRAEEHLPNTPRQIFIYQALGYQVPAFAHLPYVAEPASKQKLSKRKLAKYLKDREFAALTAHGQQVAEKLGIAADDETFNPVIVDFYRQIGYSPDALLNYLLLLGWSLDDKTEEFSRAEMQQHFSLERVNRSPASFDPAKLRAFQQRAWLALPIKQRVALAVGFLQRAGWIPDPPPCDTAPHVRAIIEAAGDRIAVAGDILEYQEFFVANDQLPMDAKAFEKRIRKPPRARELLQLFRGRLAGVEPFDPPTLERTLKEFCHEAEIKIGEIIQAIRVATTGKAVGFGTYETLAILGKERCLARIDRTIDEARQPAT